MNYDSPLLFEQNCVKAALSDVHFFGVISGITDSCYYN
jgi:hypothetical protein